MSDAVRLKYTYATTGRAPGYAKGGAVGACAGGPMVKKAKGGFAFAKKGKGKK